MIKVSVTLRAKIHDLACHDDGRGHGYLGGGALLRNLGGWKTVKDSGEAYPDSHARRSQIEQWNWHYAECSDLGSRI